MFSVLDLFKRKPSRAALAKEVLHHLEKTKPGKGFTYNSALQQITGDGAFINLANVYHDYCRAARADRAALLATFVRSLTEQNLPDTLAEARARMLPVMRHMGGLECAQISLGSEAPEADLYATYCIRPFSSHLGVGIAYDTADSVQQVGAKVLENWATTFDDVLAIALDNLRHKAAPKFEEFAPGLFVSQFNDFYDATRILLPEVAWQLPIKGQPVAMIPSRISLLICGDQDEVALGAMVDTAQRVIDSESRVLGTEMFRLDDKVWRAWQPPGQLGKRLQALQMQSLAADYQAQQEALRADLESKGQDIFVATFSLMQREHEAISSYCALTKGVNTWIPQTDSLVLVDLETEEQLVVAWAAFSEIATELLEKLPYLLPRYRVIDHPNDTQLARFRQLAMVT
ncbi:hypothetical protein [Rhodoferax sp.]|uniref:hypothetical protein n=1 Tax=Rhodoferax sp. TaxID=50421 RepID=UPI002750D852|nr:hypothetical protein [Rhodoferax sp.]